MSHGPVAGHGAVILDACCALNLYATGRAADLLTALPYRFVVGTRSRREAQWLAIPASEDREPVDLQSLVDMGLLLEVWLEKRDEEQIFLQMAAERIGDGEAEAAALAVHRGYLLATDDRKARKRLTRAHPEVRLTSTLELLQQWQEILRPSQGEMAEVLRHILERANYRPRQRDPLRSWWAAILGEE